MPREEKESSNNSSPPVTDNSAGHTRTLLPDTSQEPATFDHSSPNDSSADNREEPSSSNKSDLSYNEITRPEDTLMDKETKVSNTTETIFSKQKLAQSTEFRKRGEIKNSNEVYSDKSSSPTSSDESITLEELAELAAIEERLDQLLPPMDSTKPTHFSISGDLQSVTSKDTISDSGESSPDECPKYKKSKLDDTTKLRDSASANSSSKFKDSSSSNPPTSDDSGSSHSSKSEDSMSDHTPNSEESESDNSPKSYNSESEHSTKSEDSEHSPKSDDSESNHSPKTEDSESDHSPTLEESESDHPLKVEDSAADDLELDISFNSRHSSTIDISKSKNSSKLEDNLVKKTTCNHRDSNESNNSSPQPTKTSDESCKESTLQSESEKRLRLLHPNTDLSYSSTEDDLTHDVQEPGEDSEDTESDEESKIAMKKISLKKRPKPKIFIRKRKLSTISEIDEENESLEETNSNADDSGKVTQKSKRIKTCLKTLQSSSEESKSSYSDDDSAASR